MRKTFDPRVMTGHGLRAVALIVLLVGSAAMDGCAARREQRAQRRAERRTARSAAAGTPWIVLDGQTSDWPGDAAARADADYLYFRIALPETVTLQASPEPVTLLIDADGSARTGARLNSPRDAAGHGFDLGVTFSPPDGRGGVSAFVMGSDGARTAVPHADLGVQFAPTHASGMFELRMARHAGAAIPAPVSESLRASGDAVTMTLLQNAAGEVVGWSDPETLEKPRASAEPPRADAAVPGKPSGAVRIVSWNVKRNAPMTDSGPFSRVLQVLDADVILLQEWEEDAPNLQAWFTAVVSGERTWAARASQGGGVAIVSPHAIRPLGPERLVVEESPGGSGGESAVRWVAGIVQTPGGDVAVSSVHLKCCGGANGPEDQRRMAEAQVINAAMVEAFGESGSALRAIGGDINLVGSRPPLDTLRARLDIDGSDLEPIDAMVLGDATLATWADNTTQFTPGRLDYLLLGDAGAEVVHAFVLDTSRLTDVALARMGLDRTDTGASDHKPLVIDVRPR